MTELKTFIKQTLYSLPQYHSRDIVVDFDLKLHDIGYVDIHGNQSVKFSLVVKANKWRWFRRFRKPEHKAVTEEGTQS